MKNILGVGILLLLSSHAGAGPANAETDTAVLTALQKYDKALTKGTYTYKLAHLSRDRSCNSPIVFLNAKSGYCGTGGCNLLILDCTSKGYRIIGSTSVAMPPVYVSANFSHGYRDIKVEAGRKGLVVLKFDGKQYPENASMAPVGKKLPDDQLLLSEKDVF